MMLLRPAFPYVPTVGIAKAALLTQPDGSGLSSLELPITSGRSFPFPVRLTSPPNVGVNGGPLENVTIPLNCQPRPNTAAGPVRLRPNGGSHMKAAVPR